MPLHRRLLLRAGAAAALLPALRPAGATRPKLQVVASFSILADLVGEIAGDRVVLSTLVGPDGDAHVFQPSPADARAVAAADLVIVNGLGFEGWLDRLIAASGTRATIVTASAGIAPLTLADEPHGPDEHEGEHAHEDEHAHAPLDPHAWQDALNAVAYARVIGDALIVADQAHADWFRSRAVDLEARLTALDAEIKRAVAPLPADRRKVITSHDAFGYYAAAYGISFLAPAGLSTEAEPSAAQVAALIRQIRAERARAVFVENVSDARLVQQIARETGAVVGGTLYSDALSAEDGPADSYIAMMRHNTAELTGALGS